MTTLSDEASGPSRPSPALPHLEETVLATQRYLATVNALTDADLQQPSLLPGWSRAHVVSHVSRNAEAVTRLIHWARTGEPTPMYASQEARDREIEEGARLPLAALLADAAETAARLEAAARGLPEDRLEETVARTFDGPVFPVRRTGAMRRTEVEVHHADLGLGHTARDWPADFLDHLLKRRLRELAKSPGFVLHLTDRGRLLQVGARASSVPEVTGATPDVIWWLLGRGSGEGLRCSTGQLPQLGKWA
jgi:maleylpyruvate isomerase